MAVQKTLSDYDPKCELRIRQANKMITDQLSTDFGAKYIQKKFK